MKRISITLFASAIAAAVASAALAEEDARQCKGNPKVIGECFVVHGRLARYFNSQVKLWPVGSKHLMHLGPLNYEYTPFPKYMADLFFEIQGTPSRLFGDYLVCPFSEMDENSGQSICIESATKLVLCDVDASGNNVNCRAYTPPS